MVGNQDRRSIRLPNWDYAGGAAYFVTLVTHDRACLFDDPVLHRVAETFWQKIATQDQRVCLDAWIVMPNHVHGIIVLPAHEGGDAITQRRSPALQPGSLGAIVGNFKSIAARRINQIRRTPGRPVWQRNYYEHIIRNSRELDAIRKYILANPANWHDDLENSMCRPR
jgi:putative transposase